MSFKPSDPLPPTMFTSLDYAFAIHDVWEQAKAQNAPNDDPLVAIIVCALAFAGQVIEQRERLTGGSMTEQ